MRLLKITSGGLSLNYKVNKLLKITKVLDKIICKLNKRQGILRHKSRGLEKYAKH